MDFSNYKQLEFRRRFWKILGAAIHVTDPTTEKEVGYIEMKAWVLKEDVRFYTDETKSKEVFRIHARSVIDFGATYDVIDSATDKPLFSLRRKGMRSMFVRDHWDVYDTSDQIIAAIQETSTGLALIRRYTDIIPIIGGFIDLFMSFSPIEYQVLDKDGKVDANLTHRRNPLIVKFGMERTGQTKLDPRIAVAAVSLQSVIDGGKE